MSVNKLITNINALVNDVEIPTDQQNNVVVIDTIYNRLGVKIAEPSHEIDVSGTIQTNNLIVKNDVSLTNIYPYVADTCINIIGSLHITNDIFIDGSGLIGGSFFNTSDDRLKHNEQNINNGLEVIRQLNPQVYDKTKNFKRLDFNGILNEEHKKEAGLIAQEVNMIEDLQFTVVEGNNHTPYYLNYNNIFVYTLAAVKDLDKNLNKLYNTVNDISNLTINNTNIIKDNTNIIKDITKLNKGSNLGNIENLIKSQNELIFNLNNKINSLENRIKKLEI
tara:strand:- start:406 stop:1239 length:834 start_codon:yes stop_codon:yes gene_type:complete